jgi:hypothetical protein
MAHGHPDALLLPVGWAYRSRRCDMAVMGNLLVPACGIGEHRHPTSTFSKR